MRPRFWLSRLMLSAWVAVLGLTIVIEPWLLRHSGAMGRVASIVLLVLGAIALVDCFVNDLLPKRFRLRTIHYRYIGFPAISILLVMIAGAMAITRGPSALLLNFIVPAGFAFALTFLEIFSRRSCSQ